MNLFSIFFICFVPSFKKRNRMPEPDFILGFQQCEKFAGLPSVDESVVYVERYGHRKPIAGPSQFPGGDAGYGVAPIGRPGMFHFRKGEPGNSRK